MSPTTERGSASRRELEQRLTFFASGALDAEFKNQTPEPPRPHDPPEIPSTNQQFAAARATHELRRDREQRRRLQVRHDQVERAFELAREREPRALSEPIQACVVTSGRDRNRIDVDAPGRSRAAEQRDEREHARAGSEIEHARARVKLARAASSAAAFKRVVACAPSPKASLGSNRMRSLPLGAGVSSHSG